EFGERRCGVLEVLDVWHPRLEIVVRGFLDDRVRDIDTECGGGTVHELAERERTTVVIHLRPCVELDLGETGSQLVLGLLDARRPHMRSKVPRSHAPD